MATTRIISMHINKGKTISECLTDRTDYATNPEKTAKGELVSAFQCDSKTADAEFLLSKRQYKSITGREQKNDVIAYQIRQSFKPGEVTPEEANQLGYELAERFLKGRHAFIVATHCDTKHPHNHIIFNSTSLDCTRKFRDFLGSGKAVARLSDAICLEHELSVIENPKRGNHSYNKWLGAKAKPSHRDLLRTAIDQALLQKPKDFEQLLKLLQEAGYEIKHRGAEITFRCTGQKQPIRLSSLGDGYSKDELCDVLAGTRQHTPKKKRDITAPRKNQLLIDMKAAMAKGQAFSRWATKENLKQMAQSVAYIQEVADGDYDKYQAMTMDAVARFNTLSDQIKADENRMAEIAALKEHIINYAKTREVFEGYKKSGYSGKYLAEHEPDILLHRAAKKAFNENGLRKLPTVKSLQEEYARLLSEKKAAYPEYMDARKKMREMLIHKGNVDVVFGRNALDKKKENEHDRP